jgi:uncharacterized protein (DUF58 family)
MLGRLRWAFFGTIAALLILLGLGLEKGPLLALSIPFVVFLAARAYLAFCETPQLSAHREVSASRVSSETKVRVHLEIKNKGPRIEEVSVREMIPSCLTLVDGETSAIGTLNSGDSLKLKYTVRGRRGLAQWKTLTIFYSDHLGLRKKSLKLECPGHLFILPDFPKVYEVEIRPRQTRVYSGTVRTKLAGPGIEFFGVREYYPGDALRHLNWKAMAHRDEPVTNEFEQERVADIGIILDARERAEISLGQRSLFETSVGAASALADFFIARGNRVGLLIYGDYIDWTYPGFGKLQREKLLYALARAELSDKAIFENLENIPTRLFPAGSQLIVVSSLVDGDAEKLLELCALYHLIVVSPNPILFEKSFLSPSESLDLAARLTGLKRQIILSELRQAGVRVVDWDTSVDLPIPIEQALGKHTLRQAQDWRGSLV